LLPDTYLLAAARCHAVTSLQGLYEQVGVVCSKDFTQQGPQQLGCCCRFCLLQQPAAGQCAHQRLRAHAPAAYELLHLLGHQAGLGLMAQRVAEALQLHRQALARPRRGSGLRGGGRHPAAATAVITLQAAWFVTGLQL
jgi:hypothetical protein